jgi:hypothetical protein
LNVSVEQEARVGAWRRYRVDAAIALLLFAAAGIGSFIYWKRTYAPHQPFYYQNYFEPAVMVGCGKGFLVARPQVPAMVPFLWRQAESFSCDAIPANAPLGTDDMYQFGSWRYLMLTVGYTWRLFGVSWSALGPLFGILFGASTAALYAIFRLGMGRVLSTTAAVALCFSEYQLAYYSILRDYTKAPFTLLLFFLLGVLVTRRLSWKGVVAVAAAYGAVAGVGYGFRTDLIADLPPFVFVLFAFLAGGVAANLRLKAVAAAACVAAFLVAAWPVLSTLDRARAGCQWHVVALGFAKQFDEPLGIEPAPYEASREYLDEWLYTTVTSYAGRVHPGIGHIEFCEQQYGAATREYLGDIARRFPADIVVRAYASVLRVVELPFSRRPGNDDPRPDPHHERYHLGLAAVAVAIVAATAADVRVGLFLLFFVLFFCGMPGTQFDARHFFHLEFVPWFAAGFLVQGVFDRSWPGSVAWRRSAVLLACCVLGLIALLYSARLYQQPIVRSLLAGYAAAPREPVAGDARTESYGPVRVAPHTDPETADFVSVDIDRSRCGPHGSATFEYEPARRGYSRVFDIGRDDPSVGITQIFMPIYDGFARLAFADAPAGCVAGVYRVRDPQQFGLLVEAVLRPGWKRAPLYQRLAGQVFR